MTDWSEVPLEALLSEKKNAIAMGPFGSRIKVENFVAEGVPVIKGGNLNAAFLDETDFDFLTKEKAEELKSSKAIAGDIVITHRGTIGQVGLIRANSKYREYIVSQSQLKFTPSETKLDSTFAYYFLKSPLGQHRLLMNSSQVGVPAIAKATTSIKEILFPVPPLSDQKAIAHILGTMDEKIELNQKMNQTLEDIAKAIFKSWFVDFEPVRAKAEGRSTGLSPEISDLFPDELMDSEIGEIPRGWNVQPLSDQISINPKYSLKKDTDAYFVEMKCLSESTASVNEGYLRGFTSGSKFRRFDTLFARITPCLENGKTGLLLNASVSEVCWGSTEFIVLSPKDDQSPLFPYCWARDENLRAAAVSSMTGSSGRQRVPNDFFDRYLVANPGSSVHKTFAKIADPIIKRIQVCEEEITTLSELRDTLLPKLISGEIRISDANKFLEEAGS